MSEMGVEIFVSLTSTTLFSEHFPSSKCLGGFGAGRYADLGVMCHFLSQFKMTGECLWFLINSFN